jgi:signal peptidase II
VVPLHPVLRRPLLLAMATAIGVDQASKLALLAASPTVVQPHAGDSVVTSWLGGFIGVDAGSNSGLALGHAPGAAPVAAAVSLLVLGVFIADLAVAGDVLPTRMNMALGAALGGALANLVDRIRLGYVIDFLFVRLPVIERYIFNPADVALVGGLVALVLIGPGPWRHYWRALRAERGMQGGATEVD